MNQPLPSNKGGDYQLKRNNFMQPLEQDRIEELVKLFESHYTEQYQENDWKRLKGVRVQEPLNWLRENIEELITTEKQKSFEDGLRRAREVLPERKSVIELFPEANVKVADELLATQVMYKEGFNACREEILKAIDKIK